MSLRSCLFLIIRLTWQKSSTQRWQSFPGWGNECVTLVVTCKTGQYNHVWRIWLCSPVFAKFVRSKIVDAPLMLTLMTYQQSLDAPQLCVKMHTVIIASQWIVSMDRHLHPNASKRLHFGSTTGHMIWVMIDVCQSCYSAFGQQLTACRSVH